MLAIQWETSRACCRVGIGRPRRPLKEEFARAFISACEIIFDRLSRMETHPSSRVEHEMGEP